MRPVNSATSAGNGSPAAMRHSVHSSSGRDKGAANIWKIVMGSQTLEVSVLITQNFIGRWCLWSRAVVGVCCGGWCRCGGMTAVGGLREGLSSVDPHQRSFGIRSSSHIGPTETIEKKAFFSSATVRFMPLGFTPVCVSWVGPVENRPDRKRLLVVACVIRQPCGGGLCCSRRCVHPIALMLGVTFNIIPLKNCVCRPVASGEVF